MFPHLMVTDIFYSLNFRSDRTLMQIIKDIFFFIEECIGSFTTTDFHILSDLVGYMHNFFLIF